MIARLALTLCLLVGLGEFDALAQTGPPLQVDAVVRVKSKNRTDLEKFRARVEPGTATVEGSVENLPRGDTALVTLKFDYKIPPGNVVFDELISTIEVSIYDAQGNVVSAATIDAQYVHLNPNRVPLFYTLTLYTPPSGTASTPYFARIRVFGNYE